MWIRSVKKSKMPRSPSPPLLQARAARLRATPGGSAVPAPVSPRLSGPVPGRCRRPLARPPWGQGRGGGHGEPRCRRRRRGADGPSSEGGQLIGLPTAVRQGLHRSGPGARLHPQPRVLVSNRLFYAGVPLLWIFSLLLAFCRRWS
jgi:hypothetical protein